MVLIGRCVRCGKRLTRIDNVYMCTANKHLYCDICGRKVFMKCPIDSSELVEYVIEVKKV
ncbi:MAG: hypothetical protein QXX09_03355 [Candidatus Methanomethylicia archaeon]